MFKLINKFYQNQKTNQKKNTNIIFNENSNQKIKNNCKVDDFLIIEKENLIQNEDKQNNNFIEWDKNEFLKDFIKTILTTILDSRKDKDNNFININNNSEVKNDVNDKSFNVGIDDLFLCDDYIQNKNDEQKFITEFYLVNNKNNRIKKELVEKWKFCYKLNDYDKINDDFDLNYLKNKALLLKKSIVSCSRFLPLYQYILNKEKNDYSIEFKFYQNNYKKKGTFSKKPSGNVSLKNSILFSFKMNIKYYSEKEIKKIFNETEDYFKCIDIKKDKKIKSLSFHKTKSKLNLGFEAQNIIDNNPINENNNKCPNEIKACSTELNNNKIKDIDALSNSSSSLFLNIQDFNKEESKNHNNISSIFEEIKDKENKKEENHIKDYNDNTCKRKFSIFSNSYETTEDNTPRNSELKMNENIENKTSSNNMKKLMIHNNNKVNNFLKEYNLLKDLIQKTSNFCNIKTQKLKTYIDIFE